MTRYLCLVVGLGLTVTCAARGGTDVEKRIDALIAEMTVAEKVGQLDMQPIKGAAENLPKRLAAAESRVRAGAVGSFIWAHTNPAARNRLQRIAVTESRMKIPLFFAHDIIHGCYTAMPIAPALAGSFDMDLVARAQAVAAKEAASEGLDLVFAPMCDIARDLRWGRVAESCGEDPYLAAEAVAAQVRGFQGTDPAAADRVGACCKHFVGYGMVTGGQDYRDSPFSEWDLRQTHLPSFRAGVAAGTVSLMSGFNTVDGIPAVASRHALTDILRGEWGFRGFVVSDWGTTGELMRWGLTDNAADSARLALTAGNDIDMCSDTYAAGVDKALKDGTLTMDVLDEAVRRVLRVKFALGLFDRPYVDEDLNAAVKRDFRAEALAVAREAADKTIVLLKNDGILPLDPSAARKIAVIGPCGQGGSELFGCWSYKAEGSRLTDVYAGLRQLFPKAEFKCVRGCDHSIAIVPRRLQDGSAANDQEKRGTLFEADKAVAAAEWADTVILAIGQYHRHSGEAGSVASLQFTGRQLELFRVVAATGKKIVTVVFGGRPIYDDEVWARSSAVLFAWNPGSAGGLGVADILSGAVSPSARLSMSVPRSLAQSPCYYNAPVTGRPGSGDYTDIPKEERGAVHPFGFGLTYSTFAYGKVSVDGNVASCEIANVGDRAATEVVQLYVRQHACPEGYRPKRELRGFRRVTLVPGDKATVSFELTDATLGYTDRQGRDRCDPGRYSVWIAPDSASGTPAEYRRTSVDRAGAF